MAGACVRVQGERKKSQVPLEYFYRLVRPHCPNTFVSILVLASFSIAFVYYIRPILNTTQATPVVPWLRPGNVSTSTYIRLHYEPPSTTRACRTTIPSTRYLPPRLSFLRRYTNGIIRLSISLHILILYTRLAHSHTVHESWTRLTTIPQVLTRNDDSTT